MKLNRGPLTTLVLLLAAVSAQAGVEEKKSITLEGARKVIAAAGAEAKAKNAPGGAVAVVDDGGNLLAAERLDGTFPAAANISIGKARTAAIFRRPTKAFEEIIRNGRTPMIALPDFTPLEGGVPITADGQVIGAVGVSGAASAAQDEEIAVAAAAALAESAMPSSATNPGAVTYIDGKKVEEAFAKGAPLLETAGYKVHASRREKPGVAEIHELDTDVIYVLEGSATFVTGGTAEDPKTVAPGEIRGGEIRGGQTHLLGKGDVIVIPSGVPHWFKEVKGPFLYFVVKATAGGGTR